MKLEEGTKSNIFKGFSYLNKVISASLIEAGILGWELPYMH